MTLVARPLEASPIEPTTRIRPSEALRLGRLHRPVQIIGAMFGGPDEACALGAMVIGYGGDQDDSYDLLAREAPELVATLIEDCPGSDTCEAALIPVSAMDCVFHLNDTHLWSDDDIAGFLRGHSL